MTSSNDLSLAQELMYMCYGIMNNGQTCSYLNIQEPNDIPHLANRFLDIPMRESIIKSPYRSTGRLLHISITKH